MPPTVALSVAPRAKCGGSNGRHCPCSAKAASSSASGVPARTVATHSLGAALTKPRSNRGAGRGGEHHVAGRVADDAAQHPGVEQLAMQRQAMKVFAAPAANAQRGSVGHGGTHLLDHGCQRRVHARIVAAAGHRAPQMAAGSAVFLPGAKTNGPPLPGGPFVRCADQRLYAVSPCVVMSSPSRSSSSVTRRPMTKSTIL